MASSDDPKTGTTPPAEPMRPAHPSGYGLDCNCPACGERLWVYISADLSGPAIIERSSDIPAESDDDDDSPAASAGDEAPE